jgi:hypothetical protein
MPAKHSYQDIAFTDHAYHRLRQRSIAERAIWETIHYPEKSVSEGNQQTKFIKTYQGRRIHVVAQSIHQPPHRWLIISTWVRGEVDQLPFMWLVLTAPFRLIGWLTLQLLRWIGRKLHLWH